MNKKSKKAERKKIGGISFFASYAVLVVLAISNLRVLYLILPEADSYELVLIGVGLILGWWAAFTFFRGQTSVLIHEYKHAILSTLVGNKWKKIKLKGMSGIFHYTYTKDTAGYNAFISLAPYFLPVITLFAALIYLALRPQSLEGSLIVVSTLHGAELYFNWKDASPIQTDFTDLRGGFFVGLGYVLVANIVITSTLYIWIIGGAEGFQFLLNSLWILGAYLVALVRAAFIPSAELIG